MHYYLLSLYLASYMGGGIQITAIEFDDFKQCENVKAMLSSALDKNQFVCVAKGSVQ